MQIFDVVVVGAGAAGLFCAGVAGQKGLKVLVVDHSEKVAEKIRISGGGRCNFTNLETSPNQFLSENPYLNTAFAVILGVIILREPFTLGIALGLPLVLIGSYFASRKTVTSAQ